MYLLHRADMWDKIASMHFRNNSRANSESLLRAFKTQSACEWAHNVAALPENLAEMARQEIRRRGGAAQPADEAAFPGAIVRGSSTTPREPAGGAAQPADESQRGGRARRLEGAEAAGPATKKRFSDGDASAGRTGPPLLNVVFYNVGMQESAFTGCGKIGWLQKLRSDVQHLWDAGADVIALLEMGDHVDGFSEIVMQEIIDWLHKPNGDMAWCKMGAYVMLQRKVARPFHVDGAAQPVVGPLSIQVLKNEAVTINRDRPWHKAILMSLKAPLVRHRMRHEYTRRKQRGNG